jgi:type II secretory pathway component GspD/PulD (secretin)
MRNAQFAHCALTSRAVDPVRCVPGSQIGRNGAHIVRVSSNNLSHQRLALAIALAVLCGACSAAVAQPETMLNGDLELARLVDLASERLGVNVEYDPATLRGSVTLRLGGGVTDEELWALVNRLLAARGLTTVRMPGDDTLSVVRLGDAAGLARLAPAADSDQLEGFRTVIVRLKHADAQGVISAIEPVLSKPGGRVAALGGSDLVIVSDLAGRLTQAVDIIDRLDTSTQEPVTEHIRLEFSSAQQIVPLALEVRAKRSALSGREIAGDLLPAPDGRSVIVICPQDQLEAWRTLVLQLDREEPVETRGYRARFFGIEDVAALVETSVDFASDARSKLVVDELSGALIVTAAARQHEEIAQIFERLNAVSPEDRRQVRRIRIQNRPVDDVIGIARELLDLGVVAGSAREDPGPPDGVEDADSETPAMTDLAARADLVITADEQTSSLIAMGPPRLLDSLEALVRDLDVRQAQVMLEVLMIGLSDSQSRDLGIELQGQFEVGATSVSLASLFGLGSAPLGGNGDGNGAASGFTGLALKPGDFSVLVRALERINEGRTLTMPRVLVTNNEQATLNSVNQQPTTSINASQTVSTTSFAGFESAGTQITVRPQIAEGDHLLVEYSVSLSSFEGESSEPGVPPPRQENSIQSMATIPDGYTIVVGGIEVTTKGKAQSRVPLIGEVPLVGELFKTRSRSSARTRFYTFIRPAVLRHESFEDLKYISRDELAGVGLDDGWPTVRPRVIR